jgi:hypothetical protein
VTERLLSAMRLERRRPNRNVGVWVHTRDASAALLRRAGDGHRPHHWFDRDLLTNLGELFVPVQVLAELVSAARHKPHQVPVLSDAADPIAASRPTRV